MSAPVDSPPKSLRDKIGIHSHKVFPRGIVFGTEPARPAKPQDGSQQGLDEHVKHRDEEREWKSEMFRREHPFVVQGKYNCEREPTYDDEMKVIRVGLQ